MIRHCTKSLLVAAVLKAAVSETSRLPVAEVGRGRWSLYQWHLSMDYFALQEEKRHMQSCLPSRRTYLL